jgi:hypothetical protein
LNDYQFFRLELDFPEITPRRSAVTRLDMEEQSVDITLKFLLPSPLVGKLMGNRGSNIRQICEANDCELFVSPWGSFHPAAVSNQARTAQCSAKTLGSLSNSLMAVLESIYEGNSSSARLHFVLPKDVTTTLGPARLSALQASSGVTLYIRPPNPIFPEEQILECRGPFEAYANLLPVLCSVLPFPLHYQFGTEYKLPSTFAEPMDPAATSRWKRHLDVETASHRAGKRSKNHKWGPNRGPGHRGGRSGAGVLGAARY